MYPRCHPLFGVKQAKILSYRIFLKKSVLYFYQGKSLEELKILTRILLKFACSTQNALLNSVGSFLRGAHHLYSISMSSKITQHEVQMDHRPFEFDSIEGDLSCR